MGSEVFSGDPHVLSNHPVSVAPQVTCEREIREHNTTPDVAAVDLFSLPLLESTGNARPRTSPRLALSSAHTSREPEEEDDEQCFGDERRG
jgi:hypothetical protein